MKFVQYIVFFAEKLLYLLNLDSKLTLQEVKNGLRAGPGS